MEKNVGGWDRTLRIVAGLVLVTVAAREVALVQGGIGAGLLGTAVTRRCPLNTAFGVDTCGR